MTEKTIDTLAGSIGAGLSCACPRCGQGKLFDGFLALRSRCDRCGLDYGFADAGDGPAVFIMFFAGFIVVGAALFTEVKYHPPYWVHAMLWLPLILIVTLGPLRPMKGLMIALQYHHKAAEGRFGSPDPVMSSDSDAQPRGRQRSWRGLLVPAIIAFAILIGLGVWQIQRKAWKENLIATLTEQLAAAPQALPPESAWPNLKQSADEYRRVTFRAEFDNSKEALVFASAAGFRPDVTETGYWVFTPARLADGGIVEVNRGFVPEGRQDPKSRPSGEVSGPVDIVGVMRWPDDRHWFTPNDDPAHNLWFTRDPASIAAAKGIAASSVAPFFVEQETPVPPGGLPQPGKLVVSLPDNHLQYAITWFGLAAVLVGVFVAWAFASSRQAGSGGFPAQRS